MWFLFKIDLGTPCSANILRKLLTYDRFYNEQQKFPYCCSDLF